MQVAQSDLVVLSVAGAVVAAIALLEVLRLVIVDIYEWAAKYRRIKYEIQQTRRTTENLWATNRANAALRDRRNAERFRLNTILHRMEQEREELERRRVEVWHEVGDATLDDQLYLADLNNRSLMERAAAGMEEICPIWRYTHRVRVWAGNERQARSRLLLAFSPKDGFSVNNLRAAQGFKAVAEAAAAGRSAAQSCLVRPHRRMVR
ncbi:hypothetical protein UAJ10_21145 [Nitrospirillum sp. BR 11164]|uniref:hypothetical protein n=1 Tax=Nitrospirillum sp. BR 11164 TaxID=3104324 RepID=UPI002AFF56F6|nr:hypothetical protein [Nitrospirillum sp. BR 11164]MEA1651508.1 hypothetical protein [Nitrospirillum sp. BR 11164]